MTEMKKILFLHGLIMMMIFWSCSNQRCKSLESENKQLRQQLDSCILVAKMQKAIADSAYAMALRQREKADSMAAEARKQAEISRKIIQKKQ